MANITNYNVSPYYDDFSKLKNYVKVLFKPGRPVQARELTQLQTALQNQIGNFADHIFKNGSMVIPGNVSISFNIGYLKIESSFFDSAYSSEQINTINYWDEFIGTEITGETTGVTAEVIHAVAPEGTDPLTLFIRYTSSTGSSPSFYSEFEAEEIFVSDGTTPRYGKIKSIGNIPIGKGTMAFINAGVYYINGHFIEVAKQSCVVSKYDTQPSARVVLEINEVISTTSDDESLYDPALGTPNYSAPGADRHTITLTLTTEAFEFTERLVKDYIQLAVIENGEIKSLVKYTMYSEIMKMLSRRTYEESGDYTLAPFLLRVKEHLNDGTNNGYLPASKGGDSTKLAVALQPSVGYVKGYRVEKIATEYVDVDKARDYASYNAAVISANIGNYMLVTTVMGNPDIDDFTTLNILDGSPHDSPLTATIIGTARVRGLEHVSGTVGAATSVYQLHLFDVSFNAGKSIVDVRGFSQTGTPGFYCDINGYDSTPDTTLYYPNQNTLLFPLPYNTVKTTSDIVYFCRKTFSGVVSGGDITIAAGGTDIFVDSSNWIHADADLDGQILDPSVAITGGGSSATITYGGGYDGDTIKIIATVRKVKVPKTKTLTSTTKTITNPTGGGPYTLNHGDIYSIDHVYMSADTGTTPTPSDPDILDWFLVDDGQRKNFYDIGTLRLKPLFPAPTGQITIHYQYFSHGAGDYFAVDSYSGQVDYTDIPTYSSDGVTVSLSDVLDFRPIKNTSGNIITTSNVDALSVDEFIAIDMDYYLNRIDIIYLDKSGDFGVVKGIPDLKPKRPISPRDGMVLYYLYLNAYTPNTKSVIPTFVENKRYTMRDIGKLEKRINTLEYYTTLSLLEKETSNAQLYAGDGSLRFKNGFAVDSFKGFGVSATSHPDYRASMDTKQGVLKPSFSRKQINLEYDGITSTTTRTGDLVTIPYYADDYIRQPYASTWENVNPYNIFTWAGSLTINPAQDEWTETETLPEVIVNLDGINDDMLDYLNSEFGGTRYTDWEVTDVDRDVDITRTRRSGWIGTTTTITTTTELEREITSTAFSTSNETVNLGDRIVDVSFARILRPRLVYFRAEKLKPNTRVYPRFDDVDVSIWCKEEPYVDYPLEDASPLYSIGQARQFTSHPGGNTQLITDSSGKLEGSFFIPPDRFTTGNRVFRLSDDIDHLQTEEGSYAQATYFAQGIVQQSEEVILSTRTLDVASNTSTETMTDIDIQSRTVWIEPIAESFLVDLNGGIFCTHVDIYFKSKASFIPVTLQIVVVENGIPTQKVVPFGEKTLYPASILTSTDASIASRFTFDTPVYLRDFVEYAIVMISNCDEYEVYVAEMGQADLTDPSYVIASQPYAGSFFKSQNASTWTPDQTKDLKFTIGRAFFDIGSYDVYFNNLPMLNKKLKNNALYTVNGSTSVRVYHPNHGLCADSSNVTISGAAGASSLVNGIPIAEINTTHTSIQNVEYDSYEIVVSTSATSTGVGGGDNIYASDNALIDRLYVRANEMNIGSTRTEWFASTYGGASLAGDKSNLYVSQTESSIPINTTLELAYPLIIASQINETNEMSGNKSFVLKGTLSTSVDNLSPVVDIQNTYVGAIAHRIDNSTDSSPLPDNYNYVANFYEETDPYQGSALAKHITNRFDLNDPAASLKIWMDVNLPSETSVEVYYKIRETGDDTKFDDLSWSGPVAPDSTIDVSDDPSFLTEASYTIDETDLSNKMFTSYAVKIVMKSYNSARIPSIKEFRTVAAT